MQGNQPITCRESGVVEKSSRALGRRNSVCWLVEELYFFRDGNDNDRSTSRSLLSEPVDFELKPLFDLVRDGPVWVLAILLNSKNQPPGGGPDLIFEMRLNERAHISPGCLSG